MTMMRNSYLPTYAWLGEISYRLTLPLFRALGATVKFYGPRSTYARERARAMQAKLDHGEPVYLLALGLAGHNTGVALVEVPPEDGILMVSDEGDFFLVWHNVLAPPKDAGKRLQEWIRAWQMEVGATQSVLLDRDVVPNIPGVDRNGSINAKI